MQCSTCGHEINGTEQFCGHCGTKINYLKFCTNCGTQYEPDAQFCAKCGASISEQAKNRTPQKPAKPFFVRVKVAIKEEIQRLTDFKGTTTRFNFYTFYIFILICYILISLIFSSFIVSLWGSFFLLATSIRRMRDAGLPIIIAIIDFFISVLAILDQAFVIEYRFNTLAIINLICTILFLVICSKKSLPKYQV